MGGCLLYCLVVWSGFISQLCEHILKIRRQRCFELNVLSGCRMHKAKQLCMQTLSCENCGVLLLERILSRAVNRVTEQRMPDVRQMGADLMGTSGNQLYFKQSIDSVGFQRTVFRTDWKVKPGKRSSTV